MEGFGANFLPADEDRCLLMHNLLLQASVFTWLMRAVPRRKKRNIVTH